MTTLAEKYADVCTRSRELALLGSIDALLSWDEQVLLPDEGGPHRAEQAQYMAGWSHRRRTDPALAAALGELAGSEMAADPHSDAGTVIRKLKRMVDKKTKLPQKLVEELARLSVMGQQAWVGARKNNDFAAFRPWLEKIVACKREEAAALGFEDVPYDALLDDYEPEEKTKAVTKVLANLRAELVPLVAAIRDSGKLAPLSIVERNYPVAAQEVFGRKAATEIGFDFKRGRLDVSPHPFCSGMGPHDCRLTTRYDAHHFNGSFFGILHEAGHGIYEQGLPAAQYGLPLAEAVSLGIHESQSRMWENLVGRSRAFWQHYYPQAQQQFPEALGSVPLDEFYFAINDVRPSLIRVEADEATYNLHIIVRFELEQDLLNGTLAVKDLPAAWREKYLHYLGIEPPDDRTGCLQDIHWSGTMIGYFATYTLGNLYASQFFEQADKDLGGLHRQFAKGEFKPLREWLREKIHKHGQRYSAAELVQRVTGKPLSHAPLMRHLKHKFGPLFGLK